MAGLRDFLNGEKDHGKEARKCVKALEQELPLVAEILGGIEANGKAPEVSPSAITIYVSGGKIKFSTNVKSAEKTLHGEIADVLNPWGSINSALLVGDVSSKRYSVPPPSITEDQKASIVY